MKKERNHEIYVNYFIDSLFYCIQSDPNAKCISFEYVRERADLATDIYLTLRSMNKSPSDSLEKAFIVLFRDFDMKNFNPLR